MKREFRTLLIVTACLSSGLVGCSRQDIPAPVVAEQTPSPEVVSQPHVSKPQEAPAVVGTSPDDVNSAAKQAVALIEQLGGTVTEDLNSLDKPVTKVDLHGKPLNDKGLKAVSTLKSLEELNLSGCDEITEAGLAHLTDLRLLKKLEVGNIQRLDERGLEQLSRLESLERLNVALCSNVRDGGLKHIGRLTNLRELDLASVGGITDAGLTFLKPLTQLRWLNLYNASVTDAGLEALYGLTALETLYLNGTAVTDEGVRKLQAALPQLREVHR